VQITCVKVGHCQTPYKQTPISKDIGVFALRGRNMGSCINFNYISIHFYNLFLPSLLWHPVFIFAFILIL
jgi:hypothetical protein